MLGSILLVFSSSLALISLAGVIKPSLVMQTDRKQVLLIFFVPAVFLFLIGRSLL